MKLIILMLFLFLVSCSRFYSGESIFLINKKCLKPGLICKFHQRNNEVFKVSFLKDPRHKEPYYKVIVNSGLSNIQSISSELIGMNMEMPSNIGRFTKESNGDFSSVITPGICTKNKMLWRLKINLVLSNNTRYYTFINYQVGR